MMFWIRIDTRCEMGEMSEMRDCACACLPSDAGLEKWGSLGPMSSFLLSCPLQVGVQAETPPGRAQLSTLERTQTPLAGQAQTPTWDPSPKSLTLLQRTHLTLTRLSRCRKSLLRCAMRSALPQTFIVASLGSICAGRHKGPRLNSRLFDGTHGRLIGFATTEECSERWPAGLEAAVTPASALTLVSATIIPEPGDSLDTNLAFGATPGLATERGVWLVNRPSQDRKPWSRQGQLLRTTHRQLPRSVRAFPGCSWLHVWFIRHTVDLQHNGFLSCPCRSGIEDDDDCERGS
jgi:hypothetical protein